MLLHLELWLTWIALALNGFFFYIYKRYVSFPPMRLHLELELTWNRRCPLWLFFVHMYVQTLCFPDTGLSRA